nr:hypothetical protein [uncultured Rhodoferax sp.]
MSAKEIRELTAQTLEIMSILDRTEEFADCILWTGATGESGHPIYKPTGCPCTLVRRAMFRLVGGELERRVPIDTTCGEKLCLNEAHLVKSTTKNIAKKAARRGAWSGKARAAKIAAKKRRDCKLTIEIAREIRMSPETGPVLAARHNIHRSLVTRIKAGDAWKDYSNPFSGLIA